MLTSMTTTNPEGCQNESMESSSEDECLAIVKRKASNSSLGNVKRQKTDEDNEDEALLPIQLVKVEVNDESAEENAVEYSRISQPVHKKKSQIPINPQKKKFFTPMLQMEATAVCNICDAEFKTREELMQHDLQHKVQTRHKCIECGKCFKNDIGLRLHMKVHDEKTIKCDLCDAKFNMELHLARHRNFYHKDEKRCIKCATTFLTKQDMCEHTCCTVVTSTSKEKTPKIKTERPKESIDSQSEYESEAVAETTRESLSHHAQCNIVSKMLHGRSVADICELYNLTPEVVNQIWEDREQYDVKKNSGRMSVMYMNSVINTKLLDWFNKQKSNGVQLTGKMVTDYAEELAKELGFVAFNGSKKWLERFKLKYKLSFRSTPVNRDFSAANESKWKKQFLDDWNDTRNGFTDDMIYTADEVGVFYNPSKGRIKKIIGKKYVHGAAKDRLSVFMCANMNGTDKKRLLVCGSEDPLLRSLRDPDTLPVTYIRHPQAQFSTPMFEQYVRYWNKQLIAENKKALLIVDRASIHTKLTLTNLKLVYVPWKSYFSLMPIKHGIYTRFRNEFRKLLLEEKAMNCYRGVDRNFTCLEALNLLEKAWVRTPSHVILSSFRTVGFEVNSIENNGVANKNQPLALSDVDLCSYISQFDVEQYYTDLKAIDSYLTVDEEMLTGQGSNVSVFGGNHKVVDKDKQKKEIGDILPINTERPDCEDGYHVQKLRAMQDLEVVRRYLQTNVTSHNVFEKFMDVEGFLLKPD